MPTAPRLEYLYTLVAELGAPADIGDTPHGHRLVIPVTGGTFEGPRLRGTVRPGGGDWLLIRPDGTGELDVRGTLETDDRERTLVLIDIAALMSSEDVGLIGDTH